MILTCPACGTQYVVKDGAIPAGGRKVRCASCRHSWHQDPEPLELSPAEVIREDDSPDQSSSHTDEAEFSDEPTESVEDDPEDDERSVSDPAPDTVSYEELESGPVSPESAVAAPVTSEDEEFSPFARREKVVEKRSGAWVKLLLGLLLVAGIAAAFWFLAPPDWKAKVGLAENATTPLQLMMTHSDRQRLPSGNELLSVSGRVINPTDRQQSVPPITAELRSTSGQVVHRWTIAPPAPSLAPGESAPFNSAEVDVPGGGDELTVTLGSPRA